MKCVRNNRQKSGTSAEKLAIFVNYFI